MKQPIIALGTFDGVHLGHQKIIKEAVNFARKTKTASITITFDPHPQLVVAPQRGLRLLTTLQERTELISRLGVDRIYPIRFDHKIQKMSAEEFTKKYLVKKFKTQAVFVGFDYAFGQGRCGHIRELKRLGKKYGFRVEVTAPVGADSLVVKSSTIRELLSFGYLEKANRFLGYHYIVSGRVVRGAGRGKTLGFPTANLKVEKHKLIPAQGVYAGKVLIGRKKYKGVINIGSRPTFERPGLAIEVHIFNFKRNIIGKNIRVEFIKRLRDEKQFPDVLELIAQIKKDIARGRRV